MTEEERTMTTPSSNKGSSVTPIFAKAEKAELDILIQQENIRYTVIDPGKFIGWARFLNAMPQTVGILKFGDDFWDWLDEEKPELFVVENYIIRPKHTQGGYAHQWNHYR
jgi:hypothetical protein